MSVYTVKVVKGYQVASGKAADPLFPQGTIALQKRHFKHLGLNLDSMFNGTINILFNASEVIINNADFHFKNVQWHNSIAAESFKFCTCELIKNNNEYTCYIYQPQLATKTAHFQPKNQLEVIAPFIPGIDYNNELILHTKEGALTTI